jgi:hypothetical protein
MHPAEIRRAFHLIGIFNHERSPRQRCEPTQFIRKGRKFASWRSRLLTIRTYRRSEDTLEMARSNMLPLGPGRTGGRRKVERGNVALFPKTCVCGASARLKIGHATTGRSHLLQRLVATSTIVNHRDPSQEIRRYLPPSGIKHESQISPMSL